jgi:hypothetical protein
VDEKKRTRLLQRKQALWTERSEWDAHCREVSRFVQPRLGRFTTSEVNRGGRKDQNVYTLAAIFAHRTFAAGMMSGATSPARPWYRLTLADRDLMEFGPVKLWLHRKTELMRAIFSQSNTYNALHSAYEELGLFGTWACPVANDFENVIHLHPQTFGEYAIATDDKNHVDTLVRAFKLTVGQMVKQFGKDACSQTVRNLYDKGSYDAWVDVVHMIQPRPERDYGKLDARSMRWASCYFEPGADDERYLSESGFKRFRVLAPRWAITGNDVYGRSPGMDALGAVKELQHSRLRRAQAVDLKVNPPLQLPVALKDKANARMPGGISYFDASGPGAGIRTAYEVNVDLSHLREDMQELKNEINSAFYADLFLMLANDTRSNVTATEIAQRYEEKLLQLGPPLERLHNELLAPLIDITWDRMEEVGLLADAPDELQGQALDIEFVSTLAQAQRAVATVGMERFGTFVGQLAAAKGDPSVWDKVDTDQMVDDYAEAMGINPALVVPDDQAAAVREQRAQQAAAQQAAATAPMAADAAKTVSDINVNNLRDIMSAVQGYGAPADA